MVPAELSTAAVARRLRDLQQFPDRLSMSLIQRTRFVRQAEGN
ncbi:MAG: hypothetical protein AB7O38_30875 [Pirellulaceae bacterium]